MTRFTFPTKLIAVTLLFMLIGTVSCNFSRQKQDEQSAEDEYYVAAYIWPSCHHDERFGDMLWPDGTGEWEIIKKGNPRFEDTSWTMIPK